MDFVQRVRDSRTAQARRHALQRVTYATVVQEESVPQLGLNLGVGGLFPARKRALRPEVSVVDLLNAARLGLGGGLRMAGSSHRRQA